MSNLDNPVNFTFELVEDHLKYFFKNYEKHTYLGKDTFGKKMLKYTPFIFEVTLRESGKNDKDAIYRKMKFFINEYTSNGICYRRRETKLFTVGFHSADFTTKGNRSEFSIDASEMKNIRGKVESLSIIYEWFVKRNLKDGGKEFHIISISTPYNQEEGFVIPQDELGEVA